MRSLVLVLVLVHLVVGCGPPIVEPLPAGTGTFFTDRPLFFDGASFYQVDELTGATARSDSTSRLGNCHWLYAMDARPDGVVVAVGGDLAMAYEVDPRSPYLCVEYAELPAVMRAVAVHPDGRIFTVSDSTNILYAFDAQMVQVSEVPVVCADSACEITGIDVGPQGELYAITLASTWSLLDPSTGTLARIADIGLRDDIDIDAEGTVRGLTSGEFRTFDLAGTQLTAINLEGGTTYATGVVHR